MAYPLTEALPSQVQDWAPEYSPANSHSAVPLRPPPARDFALSPSPAAHRYRASGPSVPAPDLPAVPQSPPLAPAAPQPWVSQLSEDQDSPSPAYAIPAGQSPPAEETVPAPGPRARPRCSTCYRSPNS